MKRDKAKEVIETEDLREILTSFWLEAMRDSDAEYPDRMKASELLAKYRLGDGRTLIRKHDKGISPSEVLRLADQLERKGG